MSPVALTRTAAFDDNIFPFNYLSITFWAARCWSSLLAKHQPNCIIKRHSCCLPSHPPEELLHSTITLSLMAVHAPSHQCQHVLCSWNVLGFIVITLVDISGIFLMTQMCNDAHYVSYYKHSIFTNNQNVTRRSRPEATAAIVQSDDEFQSRCLMPSQL